MQPRTPRLLRKSVIFFENMDCSTARSSPLRPRPRWWSLAFRDLGRRPADKLRRPRLRRAARERRLVLRGIHTIHQALMHQSLVEKSRFTGKSGCPRQTWVPAFAGKASRGRRAELTQWFCAQSIVTGPRIRQRRRTRPLPISRPNDPIAVVKLLCVPALRRRSDIQDMGGVVSLDGNESPRTSCQPTGSSCSSALKEKFLPLCRLNVLGPAPSHRPWRAIRRSRP